jgi:ADP-ribose pyrophosphatase YjhB (NUDIX family)
VVFIEELSTPAINSLLHEIKKEDFHGGIILHRNMEKLKKDFFKHFILIKAAGGIVQNENKEVLFIFRRGKWDLPKGKLEGNESPEVCSKREIEEETGATGLTLKHKAGDTYHVYNEFGKRYLKMTHWYYFTCAGKPVLKPQKEEDILEAKWISTKDIRKPLANTYCTIKDILKIFFDEP